MWGRYLAVLLMSLGLALALLAAYFVLGAGWHLIVPAYPLPEIGSVTLLWVSIVMPATVLLSSLSFALGTLFPRQATLVKVIVLLGWLVSVLMLPFITNLRVGRTPPSSWVRRLGSDQRGLGVRLGSGVSIRLRQAPRQRHQRGTGAAHLHRH